MINKAATLLTLPRENDESLFHSYRVMQLANKLSDILNLARYEKQTLREGAYLHDYGKFSIDRDILYKPSRLTEGEFEKIKKHPIIGYERLKDFVSNQNVLCIILQHHERIDGMGYPYGVFGDRINKYAKIISILDSFDAMLNSRCYKTPLTMEQVIKQMENGMGTQFDEYYCQIFLKIIKEQYETDFLEYKMDIK